VNFVHSNNPGGVNDCQRQAITKIDDEVAIAKDVAATEIANESKMAYKMYEGNKIINEYIL
jgi:hypothetical protein